MGDSQCFSSISNISEPDCSEISPKVSIEITEYGPKAPRDAFDKEKIDRCLADECISNKTRHEKDNSCAPNKKSRAFLEALTQVGCKNDTHCDVKSFKRQLMKNEALKDEIRRQNGLSAGAVLEAQNLSQKIAFQDRAIEDIRLRLQLERDTLQELQEELASVTCAANECEAEREQELTKLKTELEALHHEQHAFHEEKGVQGVESEISMLRSFYETDADQLQAELNILKFENLEKSLSICRLEEEKKQLEDELSGFEEQDVKFQEQNYQLSQSIRSRDVEISKRKQEVRQQVVEVSQLEHSAGGINEAIRKEEAASATLLRQIKENTRMKDDLQKEVDAKVVANEKVKAKIAQAKAENCEVKQLVQQEVMLLQDAFVMQS